MMPSDGRGAAFLIMPDLSHAIARLARVPEIFPDNALALFETARRSSTDFNEPSVLSVLSTS